MAKFKIEMTPYVRRLVEHVSERSGKSLTATLERLLYQVELLAMNNELPKTFGLDFIEGAMTLNAQGHGAKHLDPVELGGGTHVNFDIRQLEASKRTKTGFDGVQVTTSGTFRALVPDPHQGGTKYLASRPTALLAAIDRFRWFEQYGLPYGNIGKNLEDERRRHPDWSEEQLLVDLRNFIATQPTGLKWPVQLEEVERTLARYREAHGIVVPLEVEPVPHRSDVPPIPAQIMCKICEAEIVEGEPFGPQRGGGWAHSGCVG